jgi:hypothetical protein
MRGGAAQRCHFQGPVESARHDQHQYCGEPIMTRKKQLVHRAKVRGKSRTGFCWSLPVRTGGAPATLLDSARSSCEGLPGGVADLVPMPLVCVPRSNCWALSACSSISLRTGDVIIAGLTLSITSSRWGVSGCSRDPNRPLAALRGGLPAALPGYRYRCTWLHACQSAMPCSMQPRCTCTLLPVRGSRRPRLPTAQLRSTHRAP